jgi:hypothetical protein
LVRSGKELEIGTILGFGGTIGLVGALAIGFILGSLTAMAKVTDTDTVTAAGTGTDDGGGGTPRSSSSSSAQQME